MARRVILHVGAPKTGTSFVQDRLFHNPEALAAQGILYPASEHDSQFLAALDLMKLTWGGLERRAAGAWDALAQRVQDWPDTVIISHEILGFAAPEHVRRALASFGAAEVSIVVSARDLVRQIPAEWQENVKHRRQLGYTTFLEEIRDPRRTTEIAGWFWGVQDIPAVAARWGANLPPDRVRIVTVPQPGADSQLLWQRFSEALGFDPDSLPESTARANPSLRVAEVALVRELNVRLAHTLPNERYRQFVRECLVHQNLSKDQTSPPLSVPPDVYDWASGICADWIAELDARGYAVVGDLADLTPAPARPWVDPAHPDPAELAEAGVRGLTAMILEASRLRDVEIELHGVIDDLKDRLDKSEGRLTNRAKRRLVRSADTNPVAKAGLSAYRKARGRPDPDPIDPE